MQNVKQLKFNLKLIRQCRGNLHLAQSYKKQKVKKFIRLLQHIMLDYKHYIIAKRQIKNKNVTQVFHTEFH